MTADRDALLAAILAKPEDDAPRLVYADWCSENGDEARGEFIRVQCELDRWRGPHPFTTAEALIADARKLTPERAATLAAREQELIEDPANWHWWEGDREIPGRFRCTGRDNRLITYEGPEYYVRRGFIEVVQDCTAAAWLAHGRGIRAAHPVRRVHLTTWPAFVATRYGEEFLTGQVRVRVELPGGFAVGIGPTDEAALLAAMYKRWPGVTFTLPQTGRLVPPPEAP